ncbi:hypothetical protein GCM10010394_65420 [Streptomyces crystallinus]|uniref:Uncharacterized protein n=1 Tax=Streptomyces crystallinus TaxID=68191 RepID=A0ABP3S9P8_9ACTN
MAELSSQAAGDYLRGAGNCARSGHSAADEDRAQKGRGELRDQPTTHPQTKAGHNRGAGNCASNPPRTRR